jgi:hypothetical protein
MAVRDEIQQIALAHRPPVRLSTHHRGVAATGIPGES